MDQAPEIRHQSGKPGCKRSMETESTAETGEASVGAEAAREHAHRGPSAAADRIGRGAGEASVGPEGRTERYRQ